MTQYRSRLVNLSVTRQYRVNNIGMNTTLVCRILDGPLRSPASIRKSTRHRTCWRLRRRNLFGCTFETWFTLMRPPHSSDCPEEHQLRLVTRITLP